MTRQVTEYPQLQPQNHLSTVKDNLEEITKKYLYPKTEHDLYHGEEHSNDTAKFSESVVGSEAGLQVFGIEGELQRYNELETTTPDKQITLEEFKALFPGIISLHDTGNLFEINPELILLIREGKLEFFANEIAKKVENPDEYIQKLKTSNEEGAEHRSIDIYLFNLKYTLYQMSRAGITKFGLKEETLENFYKKAENFARHIINQTIYKPGKEDNTVPFSSLTKFTDRISPYIVSTYSSYELIKRLCKEKILEGKGTDSIKLIDVITYPSHNFNILYPDEKQRILIQRFLIDNFGKGVSYLRSKNLILESVQEKLIQQNSWEGVLRALEEDKEIQAYFINE